MLSGTGCDTWGWFSAGSGVGLYWLCGSLPTQHILWVSVIFPQLSAFLEILLITFMSYSIQHLSLVLLMRNFLSVPLLNFLSPCLFGKLTIMKIIDVCNHPFCCAIPLNYLFGYLSVLCRLRSGTPFYLFFEDRYGLWVSLQTNSCYYYK